MFTDPEVDAIYITTPHNTHIEFMKQALEGGKHLLVEKSITLNSGELAEAAAMAKERRLVLGGAMLDIGVYVLSFVRWFMESKPDRLLSQVKMAPTGVDEQAGLLLMNKEGQMASAVLSLHSKQPKRGI